VATFIVRTSFPLLTLQPAHLNLWQWPQYVALFWLGTAAAGSGWLDAVPDGMRRVCGVAALLGVAGLAALFVASALLSVAPDAITGGWTGPAAALSAVEAVLAVGASVWLLGAAQRHLARPAGPITRAVGRASYAAFVLQGPVLIGLALALRPLPVSAGAKAITVGLIGVLLSFGLGLLMLRWAPLRRVL
jgi:peptidoglycan/LPS O-acetylase OafA/YrhL